MTTTESPTDAPESPGVDPPIEVGETQVEVHLPALVERPRPLVPGQDIPIIPGHQEMQGMAAMAVTLAGADAVPAALRNKPNDVFQVLLTARDLGVAITTGMREFHVIDGKVTLSPKVKLAMVNERGRQEGWACWPDPGNDAEQATWHATRRDRPGLTFSSSFTMAEARNAGTGKGTGKLADKDNWKNYPKRMLSWRALGYLLDDVFPEVGTGLYSPDELGAMTDEDGQVIDVASTEPLAGTNPPRGHGPRETPPTELPLADAEPEASAAIASRGRAIAAAGPQARQALNDLWGKGDDPLPVPTDLQVRHKVKAMARLKSVEDRISKDEFGETAHAAWSAATEGHDTVHTPESGADSAVGDGDSPEPAEATTAPRFDVPASYGAKAADLEPDDVLVELLNRWTDEMGDIPDDVAERRQMLARLMFMEDNRAMLDQQVEDARTARRADG